MSSFLRPEENTLGVIFGRRGKGGPPGVAKAIRQASARGATLGTSYLGVGAGVLSAIQALYGLSIFASQWSTYPDPLPAAFAWVATLLGRIAFARGLACRIDPTESGSRCPGCASVHNTMSALVI